MSDTPETDSALPIRESFDTGYEEARLVAQQLERRLTSMTLALDEAKRLCDVRLSAYHAGVVYIKQLTAERDKARAMVSVAREEMSSILKLSPDHHIQPKSEISFCPYCVASHALARLDEMEKEGAK